MMQCPLLMLTSHLPWKHVCVAMEAAPSIGRCLFQSNISGHMSQSLVLSLVDAVLYAEEGANGKVKMGHNVMEGMGKMRCV